MSAFIIGAYSIEKFDLVVGLEGDGFLEFGEIACKVVFEVFQFEDILLGVFFLDPCAVGIVEDIFGAEVCLEEIYQVALSYTSHAILGVYLLGIAVGEDSPACLGIFDWNPCVVAIVVDDLHLGLVFVVGWLKPKGEEEAGGHFNTIVCLWVCPDNEGDVGFLAFLSFFDVLWLVLAFIAEQFIEGLLVWVYIEDMAAGYSNVVFETFLWVF